MFNYKKKISSNISFKLFPYKELKTYACKEKIRRFTKSRVVLGAKENLETLQVHKYFCLKIRNFVIILAVMAIISLALEEINSVLGSKNNSFFFTSFHSI